MGQVGQKWGVPQWGNGAAAYKAAPPTPVARDGAVMTPPRGRIVQHGGWLPYLEKLGIEARNAQNWMTLAGYLEKNETRADVSFLPPPAPTLADAGIDKRPRAS